MATEHPREPVRSFVDEKRSLGAHLLDPAVTPPDVVAERARAIGVLRKAEEFMRTKNPAPDTPAAVRRALELAATRMGLTLAEYDDIVRKDPALVALEREVLTAARSA